MTEAQLTAPAPDWPPEVSDDHQGDRSPLKTNGNSETEGDDEYMPAVSYTLCRLLDMQRRIIGKLRRDLEAERQRSEIYRRLIADFDRQRSATA